MVSKFVAPESPLCMILWHLKTVPEIFGFKKEFTLKPAPTLNSGDMVKFTFIPKPLVSGLSAILVTEMI